MVLLLHDGVRDPHAAHVLFGVVSGATRTDCGPDLCAQHRTAWAEQSTDQRTYDRTGSTSSRAITKI